MTKWHLTLLIAVLTSVTGGCAGGGNPGATNVLFDQIEGGVTDIQTNVSGKYYSGELGDDALGMALAKFQKSVAGTKIEDDVKRLVSKYTEVSTLASKRPPIAKLRSAVQELVDLTAEVKKKL